MDKQQFIACAPLYYALAICAYFDNSSGPAFEREIRADFSERDFNDVVVYRYLSKGSLLDKAIEFLVDNGLVEALIDDFGPPVLRKTDDFYVRREALAFDRGSPFYKYEAIHDKRGWLETALRNVNTTFDELGIKEEDFLTPDNDWEPLPLDRADPLLSAAVTSLEDVVEKVRGDNGYGANVPEERNYVLKALSSAIDELKESATTSAAYIRSFVLEPLTKLTNRFKDAAIGIAASAAKEAVIDFLKHLGVKVLESLFK